MRQILNPSLPSWEYRTEGKTHASGDRVWRCGIHDRFRGARPGENGPAGWSAPAADLSPWGAPFPGRPEFSGTDREEKGALPIARMGSGAPAGVPSLDGPWVPGAPGGVPEQEQEAFSGRGGQLLRLCCRESGAVDFRSFTLVRNTDSGEMRGVSGQASDGKERRVPDDGELEEGL